MKEVNESCEYKGWPILSKQHSVRSTRAQSSQSEFTSTEYLQGLQSASKSIHLLTNKFTENFETRLNVESERNPILSQVDALFD